MISVLIPAYNCGAFIAEALDSALSQECDQPMEVVVVDDGSDDDTGQVVARYPMVRYFRHDHKGIPFSRNRCLDLAAGELLAYLDADDYWLPGKLAAQERYLFDHPDCQIVFAKYRSFVEESALEGHPSVAAERRFEAINTTYLPSALIRRTLFSRCGGFSEEYVVGEDNDFLQRIKARGVDIFHCLDEVLYMRRFHGRNSVIANCATYFKVRNRQIFSALRMNVASTRTAAPRDMPERGDGHEP